MITNSELLLKYIRSWTPGPDYPDAHGGPFKEVFKFDHDGIEAIKAFEKQIRMECTMQGRNAVGAVEWKYNKNVTGLWHSTEYTKGIYDASKAYTDAILSDGRNSI